MSFECYPNGEDICWSRNNHLFSKESLMDLLGFNIEIWQIYVIIGVILMISEIFAPGFILFPIGIGVLATALFTLFIEETTWQIVILAINIAVALFLIRKYFHSKDSPNELKTNVENMIGKEAIVEHQIDNSNNQGYVKLYGDSWRALSSESEVIPKGTRVKIEGIDGNKVIVSNFTK